MPIFMKFRHKADIYDKSTVVTPTGQKKASWSLGDADVKCDYIPRWGNVKVAPTSEQSDMVTLFFDSDAGIDYGKRIYNIKDKFGNVIDAGPFEIVWVAKESGLQGSIHHFWCRATKVSEQ